MGDIRHGDKWEVEEKKKFTPGPWGVDKNIPNWIVADNIHVADVAQAFDGDFSPFNANLIAAAPELYAALEALLSMCDKHLDSDQMIDPRDVELDYATAALKAAAAIKKARGE